MNQKNYDNIFHNPLKTNGWSLKLFVLLSIPNLSVYSLWTLGGKNRQTRRINSPKQIQQSQTIFKNNINKNTIINWSVLAWLPSIYKVNSNLYRDCERRRTRNCKHIWFHLQMLVPCTFLLLCCVCTQEEPTIS